MLGLSVIYYHIVIGKLNFVTKYFLPRYLPIDHAFLSKLIKTSNLYLLII